VNTLSYRTLAGNTETADKKWYVVNAEGQSVGRLASKVAKVIRGKYKTCYTPHADCGDNVIVINAEKIAFSGTKLQNKEYVRFSGYPGGQRFTSAESMLKNHPERLIEKAIKGMLPKNTLGRKLYTNLKVYKGAAHNHEAQQPELLNLDTLK
jgi:large subunit ribosomal protein L13